MSTIGAGRRALPTYLYTVREAAEILKVSPRTVWRKIDSGELVKVSTWGREACVSAAAVSAVAVKGATLKASMGESCQK